MLYQLIIFYIDKLLWKFEPITVKKWNIKKNHHGSFPLPRIYDYWQFFFSLFNRKICETPIIPKREINEQFHWENVYCIFTFTDLIREWKMNFDCNFWIIFFNTDWEKLIWFEVFHSHISVIVQGQLNLTSFSPLLLL